MLELAQALVRRGELERADAVLRSTIDEARDAAERAGSRLARASRTTRSGRGSTPRRTVEDELDEAVEIAASLERSR